MTETNLLPCPFCGGDANEDPESQHMPDCYFDVLARLKAAPKSDLSLAPAVVRAWNRRAQPASAPDEAESIDDRIRILSRKLGLARNHNPSPAQLRAAGIELVRPAPPKSPPAKR